MALLWIDGFESFGTTTGSAPAPTGVLASKYDTVNQESLIDVETGRAGSGRSLQLAAGNCRFHTPNFNTTNTTIIVGFAFKHSAPSSIVNAYICNLFKDTTWDMGLYFTGSGLVSVRSNASADLGTLDYIFQKNKWYYIEWKVLTDNSAGTCEVRVGGVTVLNLTGIDTQFTGFGYKNAVNWKDNTGTLFQVDDAYVCDGSGGAYDDFLGNGKVECLRPSGDSSVAWTPTGASVNYDEVDEAQCDSGTTNVSSSTANQQDLYDYDNVTDLNVISGLQVNTRVALDSAGSETMVVSAKSSTTEVNTSNLTIASTSYTTETYVLEDDPNASAAWTPTTVNAALFGVKYI